MFELQVRVRWKQYRQSTFHLPTRLRRIRSLSNDLRFEGIGAYRSRGAPILTYPKRVMIRLFKRYTRAVTVVTRSMLNYVYNYLPGD